jgi:ribonuclease HI
MHSYIKINTDGAFRESSTSGGWGFIPRNDHGTPVAAACGHIHRIGSALQAEAITVMQAMKISSQMGCSRVQLEMDTSILKNAITSTEYDLAPLGGHFKEIKPVMCNAFEDINVSVCKKSCNIVAHNLAT